MKRSRKQAAREALTAVQVRERKARKQMEADRASWLLIGGQVAWQAELDRRRAARCARVRAHTAAVLAAKRGLRDEGTTQEPGTGEQLLFGEAA